MAIDTSGVTGVSSVPDGWWHGSHCEGLYEKQQKIIRSAKVAVEKGNYDEALMWLSHGMNDVKPPACNESPAREDVPRSQPQKPSVRRSFTYRVRLLAKQGRLPHLRHPEPLASVKDEELTVGEVIVLCARDTNNPHYWRVIEVVNTDHVGEITVAAMDAPMTLDVREMQVVIAPPDLAKPSRSSIHFSGD